MEHHYKGLNARHIDGWANRQTWAFYEDNKGVLRGLVDPHKFYLSKVAEIDKLVKLQKEYTRLLLESEFYAELPSSFQILIEEGLKAVDFFAVAERLLEGDDAQHYTHNPDEYEAPIAQAKATNYNTNTPNTEPI